uniref:Uncharacterized protein n=1 Tax=Helianthus annuus TaxID=4232 RepID=A0A251URA8_HELAN
MRVAGLKKEAGFGISAARLGLRDTGLISYGEMVDQDENLQKGCYLAWLPPLG